jgi:hypothetical protein
VAFRLPNLGLSREVRDVTAGLTPTKAESPSGSGSRRLMRDQEETFGGGILLYRLEVIAAQNTFA